MQATPGGDIHGPTRIVREFTRTLQRQLDYDLEAAHAERFVAQFADAIVLASPVVGSALIVLPGVPPIWHEIPLIGLVGFMVAALMGFLLLVSILRGGKM